MGALNEERASAIDAYPFDLPFALIEQQVQAGALLTGDAVLNFANRVAEATKRYFIQETDSWKKSTSDNIRSSGNRNSCSFEIKKWQACRIKWMLLRLYLKSRVTNNIVRALCIKRAMKSGT
ncbi:hypothetical protein OL548_16705 [Lysinibacillus sp. MHQ-1]|nr:hypothetical protein OL548_16705 [Lysinibacillus sp. MHQ-1]